MAKKKGPKGLQHIGIERRTLKMKEWRGLIGAAKIFYLHLKGRYNGSNNGEIELPYRAMKDVEGCRNPRTISRASKELQKKEWIEIEKRGGLYRHKNLYKLTFKYDFYGAEKAVSKYRDKNKI